MIGAGKSGTFYLLNRDDLGHFSASSDSGAIQSWTASGQVFSTPAFWNNNMFFFGTVMPGTQLGQQYTFDASTGVFTTTPGSSTARTTAAWQQPAPRFFMAIQQRILEQNCGTARKAQETPRASP
jgi:hypothetical protein